MAAPNKIKWGILGLGKIAGKFAKDLKKLPNAELLAVGSRSIKKAEHFAKEYGALRVYGSYEALVQDSDVDIIYIATPHSLHCENTIMCLSNRKAVLCEKPLAVNAQEVRAMLKSAHKNQLFLMEAMWMRYMPVMLKVKYWLAANKIGEICTMSADFGFLPKDTSPIKRLYNKELAGGALLDIGIYPLTLAFMVFGKKPRKILAEAVLGRGGVDEQTAMILSYENGAMARLFCSIRVGTPCEAVICGTKGSIVIHSPFWHGGSATLSVNDEKSITVTGDTGFYFEAADAMQCLKKGHLESSLVPLSESLAITECMDEVRQQIGLQYPADQSNAAEKLDKPGTKTYSHDQAWN